MFIIKFIPVATIAALVLFTGGAFAAGKAQKDTASASAKVEAAKDAPVDSAQTRDPATSPNNPDNRSGVKSGISATINEPSPTGQTVNPVTPYIAPGTSKVVK